MAAIAEIGLRVVVAAAGLATILLGLAWFAQGQGVQGSWTARPEPVLEGPVWTTPMEIWTARPHYVVISGKSGELVKINTDTGEVIFGPNYSPSEAAKEFWLALGKAKCE